MMKAPISMHLRMFPLKRDDSAPAIVGVEVTDPHRTGRGDANGKGGDDVNVGERGEAPGN